MELNEVKIGDTVSFTHKGKKITGKVIHRHDGTKNAALAGHINVQPMDADSRPHTIHVSKIKPAKQIKEDIQMANLNEAILDLIDNIEAGNNIEANNIFNQLLQTKIDELLDAKKVEVSASMFNTEECADCVEEEKKMKKEKEEEDEDEEDEEDEEELDEALKGKQHKIDANKNGKIDAHDFKMLRAKKGMKEEVESTQEAYADPYAAKKSAEMKKNYKKTMADAKKEFESSKESKGKVTKNFMKMKEEVEEIDEASYSAKKARAGKDIGKKGKMFSKIAKKVGKKYGSAEKGKKVAGAILKKLRMKESTEVLGEEEYDYYRDYKLGGATYDEYKSATRNFQARQHKMLAKKRAPEVKEPHSVHINGKKWKSFSSHGHATNVAKKLAAKGGNKKFTVHKD